ncbi:YPS7 [Candida oxycetoniae]|uniref:YPS7 n=1 Tax=Candida oxycetoniae TaxID=497107 RepID=A0AAI9T1I2_9ASCO|nr:YPS7 [Candida oxycetoniae]KAI3406541.2 YPS7 [Candida oxycetoniae]
MNRWEEKDKRGGSNIQCLVPGVLAADGDDDSAISTTRTGTTSSLGNEKTLSEVSRVTLVGATQTTRAKESSTVSSTATPITTRTTRVSSLSVASSKTTENEQDQKMFKLVFTIGSDDSYYNAQFQFGDQKEVGLRLDLVQPEIWVMNQESFVACSEITNCARRGVYTSTALESMPTPSSNSGVSVRNGQDYIIPYMNPIQARGEFVTDNMNFNITNGMNLQMSNITFLDANVTNMYVGGLGLAIRPQGSGFLPTLVEQGIIRSPGYSLWFNTFNDTDDYDDYFAQLLPGVVNTKYLIGDLYEFEMLPHSGTKYPEYPYIEQDLARLTLPVINLDDIRVERLDLGESLSMKSDDEALPVLLDSRIIYSYLPLSVIVNLAIQTNAYYSAEAGRWLVECDTLSASNATIVFQIGSNLSIKVPIRDFLIEAVFRDNLLHFESGAEACYLTLLPNSASGFNALGLPFLKHIYLVVDNEGSKVAIAQTNSYLNVNRSTLFNDNDEKRLQAFNQSALQFLSSSSTSTSTSTSTNTNTNTNTNSNSNSNSSSIAYIESGTIPFATSASYIHKNGVLSYSKIDQNVSYETVVLDIPARLSGAVIRSGSIYVTGYSGEQSADTEMQMRTSTFANPNSGSSNKAFISSTVGYKSKFWVLFNYGILIAIILGVALIL